MNVLSTLKGGKGISFTDLIWGKKRGRERRALVAKLFERKGI